MPNETAPGPLVFGEALFDCFPDGGQVLGGAPFNVAWHLQAFGEMPLFISRVGQDPAGGEISDRMREWGMRTDGLQQDATHPTGTVAVTYREGEPCFEILPDQAYDFIEAQALPETSTAPLLYHGSLAVRSETSRAALRQLKREPRPVFLDVNLRAPWWEKKRVLALIADARWAKLNLDELQHLTGCDSDPARCATEFRAQSGLDLLVVTRGAEGALAVSAHEQVEVRPDPDLQVVDPVGAGDAFSAALILGLLRRWPLDQTMQRAQAFAGGMVKRQGATVDERDFYRPFLDQWGIR